MQPRPEAVMYERREYMRQYQRKRRAMIPRKERKPTKLPVSELAAALRTTPFDIYNRANSFPHRKRVPIRTDPLVKVGALAGSLGVSRTVIYDLWSGRDELLTATEVRRELGLSHGRMTVLDRRGILRSVIGSYYLASHVRGPFHGPNKQ